MQMAPFVPGVTSSPRKRDPCIPTQPRNSSDRLVSICIRSLLSRFSEILRFAHPAEARPEAIGQSQRSRTGRRVLVRLARKMQSKSDLNFIVISFDFGVDP